MNPSGVMIKPEPLPLSSRVPRWTLMRCLTSMFTTAGETRATALTTVREYASSKRESSWPATAVSKFLLACDRAESVSFKRKSIGAAFSFVRDAIVIYKFRTGQTISQLQMVSGYTFILERYSLLARQRELFYTEACERCPPTLP